MQKSQNFMSYQLQQIIMKIKIIYLNGKTEQFWHDYSS